MYTWHTKSKTNGVSEGDVVTVHALVDQDTNRVVAFVEPDDSGFHIVTYDDGRTLVYLEFEDAKTAVDSYFSQRP